MGPLPVDRTGIRPADILFLIALGTCGGYGCTWERTYGGGDIDIASSVQPTTDGGFIIGGYTSSFGADGSNFWLVKTDLGGNQLWNRTFGIDGDDVGTSVQQTADGGYVVSGYTDSLGAGSYDFWLVKTDGLGHEEWNKTFGGRGSEQAQAVQQTSDGGYVLAGSTSSVGGGSVDFWVVKTDPLGKEEWSRAYGGYAAEWAWDIHQTGDGGYIVAGATQSFGAGGNDVWLVKTDALGNQDWDETYGGTDDELAYSLDPTADGGYILAGVTGSFGTGDVDLWLVKTDAFGVEEWNRTYGGYNFDRASSVRRTADGGYIVAGESGSFGGLGDRDLWLLKTDDLGNEAWNRVHGGLATDVAHSIEPTGGGYIVAGWTTSFGAGSSDFYVLKTDAQGNVPPSR
jgi:hypothetical protein